VSTDGRGDRRTTGRWAPLAGLALLLGAGCGSSSGGGSQTPTTSAVCPDSVAAAIGASCETQGLTCAPQYTCGITPVTITCVCTAGTFACVDVSGVSLSKGSVPDCPDALPEETCPTTQERADLAPCTEIGLACAYPETCDATPAYVTCQCALGQLANGTMGTRFQCDNVCSESLTTTVQNPEMPGEAGGGSEADSSSDASVVSPPSDATPPNDDAGVRGDASSLRDAAGD
jgi:hypothetical protein